MYSSLKQALTTWSSDTSDRQKLQHAYVGTAIALLIAAGVVGLLNYELGQKILAISIASAGVFLINAVAWALLQSFILLRLRNPHDEEVSVAQKKAVKK